MKKIKFNSQMDGFYATYYENSQKTDATVIGLFGDDPNDFMAKQGVKWLHKLGVNALCMSPAEKNYSHVNVPIETVERAIQWLKVNGTKKIGIMGMSTMAMFALTAASYLPDITMTIALTPSGFVWQGFEQGKKDGCKEWPVEGASTISWRGKPLPYMPFVYQHPEYWKMVEEETKGTGNYLCSRKIFDDSDEGREHTEEEMIKIENIQGDLYMVAAKDDTLWDAAKYVMRMEKRLQEREHACTEYKALVYEYGTHFVLLDSLLKSALPIGLVFDSAKRHKKRM